jgi:hypothetical protein
MKLTADDLTLYREPAKEFDVSSRTPIEPAHREFMAKVIGAQFMSEHGIWKGHTCRIAAALPAGTFSTTSRGSKLDEPNCWLAARPGGEFYCQRYGSPNESTDWTHAEGRTWCVVNQAVVPSIATVEGRTARLICGLENSASIGVRISSPESLPSPIRNRRNAHCFIRFSIAFLPALQRSFCSFNACSAIR